MSGIKNLYSESKKLRLTDKRTRRSLLRNIDNLDFHQKMLVIIYYTECEKKSKEYKKFWYILKERYSIKDLFESDSCSNLFLVCPKREVIKELKSSARGLEIISKIYQNYEFLSFKEKIDLLENFYNKKVKNLILEKETGKVCTKDGIEDVCVESTREEDIIKSCNSLIILKYLQSRSGLGDKILFRNLIYILFEEGNIPMINSLRKSYDMSEIFTEKGSTLESLSTFAFFHGNRDTDLQVLRILAKQYDTSQLSVINSKILLLRFKYPKFTSENMRKFILDNIWASEFLGDFLRLLKDLLPTEFFLIIQREDLKYTPFFKLIDNFEYKYISCLIYKNEFFEVAMKSSRFKKFMLSKGFTLFNDKDLLDFIARWTKREDLEFYLLFLIKYRSRNDVVQIYEAYKNNKVAQESKTIHLNLFNLVQHISSIIESGEMASEYKDINLYFMNFYKTFNRLDIQSLFNDTIGMSLLSLLIQFLTRVYFLFPQYQEEMTCFFQTVFRINQTRKNDLINKEMWIYLQHIPELFLSNIENFEKYEDETLASIIRGDKPSFELKDLEIYETSPLVTTVIDYIVKNYTLSEVLDVLISKYEDERDFYYEIVLKKSQNHEYDTRILQLEDSLWLDKIFDEIFVEEKDEIFDMLKSHRSEFLFDYSVRHKKMRKRYFDLIDKNSCTRENGLEIYKIINKERVGITLEGCVNYIDAIYKDASTGNIIYKCASSFLEDLDNLDCSKIELIYLLSFIRPDDGKYFLFKYFSEIVAPEVKNMKKNQNKEEEMTKMMLDFIFSVYLVDKYFVFVMMGDLIDCLRNSTQTGKYLLLKNFNSLNVTRAHIAEFLDIITSLLHDTNVNICTEAKRLLNNVSFMSPEMHSLRSQLIQCLIDKIYVKPFFETLYVQTFNHYMCINSLTLLVQVLRIYIKDYKEDVLFIIRNLPQVVKPSDFSYITPSIFNIMSKFVIEYQFYTEEVVKTALVVLKYSKNVDFTLLIDNIDKSLSVGCLLVKTLKECDVEEQRRIIGKVIKKEKDDFHIPNNFLAYAPDLQVFNEYIEHIIPLLKEMYEGEDYEKRKIAFNAFERINITDYLIQTALVNGWAIRLNTLDLFLKKNEFSDRVLAVIFILRHDPHSVVRKKAYELWKMNVENPNKKLKDIHCLIFEYVRYVKNNNALRDSTTNTISEIVTKYVKYCEYYIQEHFIVEELFDFSDDKISDKITVNFDDNLLRLPYIDVIEILLVECTKANKQLVLAYMFATQFISVPIYKYLLQNDSYKDKIIELIKKNIQDERLKEIFQDSKFAFDLYNTTGNSLLLENMNENEKYRLLQKNISDLDRVREIFRASISSSELEQFILEKDVDVQFLYLENISKLCDFGSLQRIFNSVFMKIEDGRLQVLICKKNTKFILEVSYKNIRNFDKLFYLILQNNTLRSLERLYEIVEYVKGDFFTSNSLLELIKDKETSSRDNSDYILGYLLYNYLFYENRSGVKNCLMKLIPRIDLKEYKDVIERNIIN